MDAVSNLQFDYSIVENVYGQMDVNVWHFFYAALIYAITRYSAVRQKEKGVNCLISVLVRSIGLDRVRFPAILVTVACTHR